MPGNNHKLNYKQVTNVKRRTWDSETYSKKAKDREEQQQEHEQQQHQQLRDNGGISGENNKRTTAGDRDDGNDDDDGREEFMPALKGSAGPEGSRRAFLKARRGKVIGIDEKVGSTDIISVEGATKSKALSDEKDKLGGTDNGVQKVGIGWHCKVCDCFLKDSHTYLDHINGRKHQRALGYSMRVERSSKEQLLDRLQQLTNASAAADKNNTSNNEIIDLDEIVRRKDDEEKQRKEERQRKRKERKEKLKSDSRQQNATSQQQQENPEDDDDVDGEADVDNDAILNVATSIQANEETKEQIVEQEDDDDEFETEGIDPTMAAMMGFTGFGSR